MRIAGLNLRDFEYVIAVAEMGSFVKAAERCHVSQPSLSIQIGKLEERLNTVIFERSNRRTLVTFRGMQLIEQMRKIIAETGALLALANVSTAPFGGTLKLAAIPTLGPYYFPHVIQELRLQYPDLMLILGEGTTNELIPALFDGSMDAILVATDVSEPGLQAVPLFFEPFFMASRSASGPPASDDDAWHALAANDRLVLSEGHCLRGQALAVCSDVSASRRHAASLETLRYMVAAGEGSTLMPALAATETNGVTYLPLHGAGYGRTVSLVWRRSDPRTAELAQIARHLQQVRPAVLAAIAPIDSDS